MKVIGKQSSGIGLVASGTLGISIGGNNELLITQDTTFISSSLVVSESLFVSGNTHFGISTESRHDISGNLFISGNYTQVGVSVVSGSVLATRDSIFIQDVYVSGTLKGPFSQSIERRVNALEEQRFFLRGDVSAEGTLSGTSLSKYTASLDISLNQISASQLIFPSESRKVYVAEYGSDNLLTPHRGKSPATPFKTIKAGVQSIYSNVQISASQVSGSGQSGSATEASIISQSYATVAEILAGGLGVTPVLSRNGSTALVSIGTVSQSFYDDYGTNVQSASLSSSFATTLQILSGGLGNSPALVPNGLVPVKLSNNTQITGTGGTNAVSASISSSFAVITSIVNGGLASAPVVTQNSETITTDADKLNARNLILRNKGFIQDEVIEYLKIVYPFFTYNVLRCKRDVGLLIDAVLDDLVFGGNEKTVEAGTSYYNGNFGEVQFGGSGVANSQKEETIAAILYASRMAQKISVNGSVSAPSNAVRDARIALLGNISFIQEEVLLFIEHVYVKGKDQTGTPFTYDRVKCRRDIGYIVTAAATDLVLGGNQQSIEAGAAYYNGVYGNGVEVIDNQLEETVNSVSWGARIAKEVVVGNTVPKISNNKKNAVSLLEMNKRFLGEQTVGFISASFPNLIYSSSKCSRDVGLITDCVIVDLIYGGNEQAINAGTSYYTNAYGQAGEVPANQLTETVAGILYAGAIAQKISKDEFVTNTYAPWFSPFTNYNTTVYVETGTYVEDNPIVLPPGVAIKGDTLRQSLLYAKNPKLDYFHVHSSDYIDSVRFLDLQRPAFAVAFPSAIIDYTIQSGKITNPVILYSPIGYTSSVNIIVEEPDSPPESGSIRAEFTPVISNGKIVGLTYVNSGSGYVSTERPHISVPAPENQRPFIQASPYVWNSSAITGPFNFNGEKISELVPLPYDLEDLGVDNTGAGGGMRVDGNCCREAAPRSPLRSMVAAAFTQVNQGGPGHHVCNTGYAQFVSMFTTYCTYGFKTSGGGFANISNSVIDFGLQGVISKRNFKDTYTSALVLSAGTSTVAGFNVTIPGSGYTVSPVVTITGGGGNGASGSALITSGQVVALNLESSGSGYTSVPSVSIALPDTPGGIRAEATAILSGLANIFVRVTGSFQGQQRNIDFSSLMKLNGSNYLVTDINTTVESDEFFVETFPAVFFVNAGDNADFYQLSNISTGGLVLEYVGAGITYNAIPEYGGIPDSAQEVVMIEPGKVFAVTIDNRGNLKVGRFFRVDQLTGAVTIDANQFSLSGLSSIGPFRRNGVPVGIVINEASDNDTLLNSQGIPGRDTVPSQQAVKTYVDARTIAATGTDNQVLAKSGSASYGTQFRNTIDTIATNTLSGSKIVSRSIGSNLIVTHSLTSLEISSSTIGLGLTGANGTPISVVFGTQSNQSTDGAQFTAFSQSVSESVRFLLATSATTASNTFVGNQLISGNVLVTGSVEIKNDLTVSGSLLISDTVALGSNVNISGNLSVTGSTVLTGGLDVFTNTNIQSPFTASGLRYPNSDSQGAGKILRSDGNNGIFFGFTDRTSIGIVNIGNGGPIAKGTPLYIKGFDVGTGLTIVGPASASQLDKMPAVGLSADNLLESGSGSLTALGILTNYDTTALTPGQTLYVAPNGGLTTELPTGSFYVQNMAIVGRININDGELLVEQPGTYYKLPNIPEDWIWIGADGGYAVSQSLTGALADRQLARTVVGVTDQSAGWYEGALVVSGGLGVAKNAQISGNLTIYGNFDVKGSTTITAITASNLDIAENTIAVREFSPVVRFGGLIVWDSGSVVGGTPPNNVYASASLFYDGLDNNWVIAQNDGRSSSLMIGGPVNGGAYGNEEGLPMGTIPVIEYTGNNLTSSTMTDNGLVVRMTNDLLVTGSIAGRLTGSVLGTSLSIFNSLSATGSFAGNGFLTGSFTGSFTGSADLHYQISGNVDDGIDNFIYSGSKNAEVKLATGSLHFTDGVKKKLNTELVISSSEQIREFGYEFSSSVNVFTSSVKIELAGLNSYTSSLKTAISASGSDLIVHGNLRVTGSKTFIESTDVKIVDKFIEIASGSIDSAAADGAGLFFSGANFFFSWSHQSQSMNYNKTIYVEGNVEVSGSVDGTKISQFAPAHNTFSSSINAYTSSLRTAVSESNGDLIVFGNLQVRGTLAELRVDRLQVKDKQIEINSGSTTSAQSDKAGLFISGANVNFYWDHPEQYMYLDKNFTINGDFNASTINGINLPAFRNGVNQATGALEVYSSSLKNAITVAGTGVSSVTTIQGDLNVLGTTTQLQISDLKIEDKLIEVASGSTSPTLANGAGLFISGANVFFSWSNAESNMRLRSNLFVGGTSGGAITASTLTIAESASMGYVSASQTISGGALFIEGNTSLRGNVTSSGTVSASALYVQNATNIVGVLDVVGNIIGEEYISASKGITGSGFWSAGDIRSIGNTQVDGTALIIGATTVRSTISASGAISGSGLQINGNFRVTASSTYDGFAVFNNDISASGYVSASGLRIYGEGSLGTSSFWGPITGSTAWFSNNFRVTGSITASHYPVGHPLAGTGGNISASGFMSASASNFRGEVSSTLYKGDLQYNVIAGSGLSGSVFRNQTDTTLEISTASVHFQSGSQQSIISYIKGDVTIATDGTATIAANSIALGTDTTGDYVASINPGAGLTGGATSGEGIAHTLAVGAGDGLSVAADSVSLNTGSSHFVNGARGTIAAWVNGDATINSSTGYITVNLANIPRVTNVLGTTNQISVSGIIANGGMTASLSLPQNIHTAADFRVGSLGIGVAASGTSGRIDAANDIVAYSSSDRRFKENIKNIPNALAKILRIGGYEFDWISNVELHGHEGHDIGVIAQEIEEILPELVQTRESGYKAVKYDKLVALLIEGMKEQQVQIDNLKSEVENLKRARGL
jgi:hypothetical protein